MAWFHDRFLPSLFDRAGVDNGVWLSAKQTAVCTRNMARRTTRYQTRSSCGEWYNHDDYFTVWCGRDVMLAYSKRNGCGMIRFSRTEAEVAAQTERNAADRLERERERARRLYERAPERWQARVNELRQLIVDADADDADAKELGQYDAALSEQYMARLTRELAILQSVAR